MDLTDNVKQDNLPSYRHMVWHNFRKKPFAFVGLWISLLLFFVAIFAPLLANGRPIFFFHEGQAYWPVFSGAEKIGQMTWKEMKKHPPLIFQRDATGRGDFAVWPVVCYSPTEYDLLESLSPPSWTHWLGTDDSGRDILSRMIHGARVSLSVGFVAVGIALVIGIGFGATAGVLRGLDRSGHQ